MINQIFVNLPVKNLDRSVQFFTKMNFKFDPQFTDKNAACLIIGENIYAMLLVEDFFTSFTKKKICDPLDANESILALRAVNREEVDNLMKKAIEAGGIESRNVQDEGWMYGRGFKDLDGHMWEVFYMNLSQRKE